MLRPLRTLTALMLAAATLVFLSPSASATAVTVTVNDVVYAADDGDVAAGATVTDYTGPGGSVTILPSVDIGGTTYVVKTIGVDAFHSADLTGHLTIPDSVTTIQDYAFFDNSITGVDLGSVVTVGANAFNGNAISEPLVLPDTLVSIGLAAFKDMRFTEPLVIPDSVVTIGASAFEECSFTGLTLGTSISTIGSRAFRDDNVGGPLVLPDSLTSVGDLAFYQAGITGALIVPDQVTTVGRSAFQTNHFSSLIIGSSVTSIADAAFGDNFDLTAVRFTGPAPTTFGGDVFTWGSGPPGLIVRFPYRFGASQTPGGYTTPTWSGNAYPTIAVATVSYEANGGTPTPQSADVDIDGSSTATEPAPPAKSGKVFTGWYTDPGLNTAYAFSSPVTSDLTLYAKYIDAAVTGLAPTISGLAQVGATLTADPGPVEPANASLSYTWRADGSVITGATGPTYKLKNAQAGRRISVTITASSPGLDPQTETSASTPYVREHVTRPQLTLDQTSAAPGNQVTISAKGLKPGQTYRVFLNATTVLTAKADIYGEINKPITIPATRSGIGIVTLTGPDGSVASTIIVIADS